MHRAQYKREGVEMKVRPEDEKAGMTAAELVKALSELPGKTEIETTVDFGTASEPFPVDRIWHDPEHNRVVLIVD